MRSIWLAYGISNRAAPRPSAGHEADARRGSIRIEAGQHGMRLTYRYRQRSGAWQEVHEAVPFTETATCFGGRRRFMKLPAGGPKLLCIVNEPGEIGGLTVDVPTIVQALDEGTVGAARRCKNSAETA